MRSKSSILPYWLFLLILLLAHTPSEAETLNENVESSTSTLEKHIIVELEQGQIKGFHEQSSSGKNFYSFLGIPYAKPPTGERRFKGPEAADGWDGIRDGCVVPPSCSQINIYEIIKKPESSYVGEEDCLFVNVYTPEPNFKNAMLPVMVYLHGGQFVSGSASDYEPYDLMDNPVVLVVVQYRLGVLGFLSTEDSIMPGNLGLRDQTVALKWVHEHIDHFGGNFNSVTLFGSGSGAASVHYQILSHHTIGLFKRAILQSGTALCPWAGGGILKDAAHHIGRHFKCLPEESPQESKEKNRKSVTDDSIRGSENNVKAVTEEEEDEEKKQGEFPKKEDDNKDIVKDKDIEKNEKVESISSEELLQCLQNIEAEKIVQTVQMFYVWSNLPTIFGPYVDQNFLPESPEFLLQNGRHKRVDLIIGINKDDGSFLTDSMFLSEGRRLALKHHFPHVGPITLEFTDDDLAPLNMSVMAYDKYVGGIQIDALDASNLTRMFTDRHFAVCSDLTADWHSYNNKNYKKNVYYYELHHRGQRSMTDDFALDLERGKISQGDELYYLFPMNKSKNFHRNEDDIEMKNIMTKMWFHFADSGNPSPNGTFEYIWEPYTAENRHFLKLLPTPTMEKDYRNDVREFWTSLPTRQNMFLYKDYFTDMFKQTKIKEEMERKEKEKITGDNKNKDNKDKQKEEISVKENIKTGESDGNKKQEL